MWEGLFRVGAGGQRTPLSDRLRCTAGFTENLGLFEVPLCHKLRYRHEAKDRRLAGFRTEEETHRPSASPPRTTTVRRVPHGHRRMPARPCAGGRRAGSAPRRWGRRPSRVPRPPPRPAAPDPLLDLPVGEPEPAAHAPPEPEHRHHDFIEGPIPKVRVNDTDPVDRARLCALPSPRLPQEPKIDLGEQRHAHAEVAIQVDHGAPPSFARSGEHTVIPPTPYLSPPPADPAVPFCRTRLATTTPRSISSSKSRSKVLP